MSQPDQMEPGIVRDVRLSQGAGAAAGLGGPCPLVTGADVAVPAHPAETVEWQALRDTHPSVHPGVPICVELTRAGNEVRPGERPIEPGLVAPSRGTAPGEASG